MTLCIRAAMLLTVLLLKACGGSAEDDHHPGSGRAQAASAQAEALFARDGRPSAAARQPPEGYGPRTRAGLYATPEQLEWELLTVEPYTVLVDVDQHPSADAAVELTLRNFYWSGESARAAFFVRAADTGRAVAVADELTAAGVPNVFLVVQR